MDSSAYIAAFVTLFVIVDPIGLLPMFVALTQGSEAARRRAIALRSVFTAAILLTMFALLGEQVLGFVGISMPAFRIAGGILLFMTALDMLFERRAARRQGQAQSENDPSIFPIAIPLIAGPGSIATIILLVGQSDGAVDILGILGVMVAVLLIVLLLFLIADRVETLLGQTGITVATRLLGMLLAALSVQFVLDGLAGFGFGPGGVG